MLLQDVKVCQALHGPSALHGKQGLSGSLLQVLAVVNTHHHGQMSCSVLGCATKWWRMCLQESFRRGELSSEAFVEQYTALRKLFHQRDLKCQAARQTLLTA